MHRLSMEHARLLITLERSRARPLLAPSTQRNPLHEGGGEFFSSSFVTFVLDRTQSEQRAARASRLSKSSLSLDEFASRSIRATKILRPFFFSFFFIFISPDSILIWFPVYLLRFPVYENMIEDNGLDERGSFKEEFCFCKFV